jgi:hypothetical protein
MSALFFVPVNPLIYRRDTIRSCFPFLAFFALTLGAASTPAPQSSEQLPDPGPHRRWEVTFDDEFNGNSVDHGKWNGGYANLQWCHGETFPHSCAQDYDRLMKMGGGVESSLFAAGLPTAVHLPIAGRP